MRRSIWCAVVAVACVPVVLSVAPASAAPAAGGVIIGSAWLDRNGDGIRQADEPPLANFGFLLPGTSSMFTANTDANGNYRFENIPAGQYVVAPFSLRSDIDFTRSGRDSDFNPCTAQTAPFTLTEGGQVGPLDAGFVTSRHDFAAGSIRVPRLRVGSEVDIRLDLVNHGNVADLMWGTATFPAGLTPLSTSGYFADIVGQQVFAGNMFAPRTCSGDKVSVLVHARVDAPISRGELKLDVPDLLMAPDVHPDNNVRIKRIHTVG
jgi:hypothetical protein